MNSRKRARGRGRGAQVLMSPEFGDETASFFGSSRGEDRKVKQLCREVHRVLTEVLSGEVSDPRVAGLLVDSVAPAPDASRLLVLVLLPRGEDDAAAILVGLDRLKGFLRAEIAAAIQRKRTPELGFQVLTPGALGDIDEHGEDDEDEESDEEARS
jgi:ribosome-binding factor A